MKLCDGKRKERGKSGTRRGNGLKSVGTSACLERMKNLDKDGLGVGKDGEIGRVEV